MIYVLRLQRWPENVERWTSFRTADHRPNRTDFSVDLSGGFCFTRWLILSKLEWRVGVPTSCFIWSLKSSLLHAYMSSGNIGSSTSPAVASITRRVYADTRLSFQCRQYQTVGVFSLRVWCRPPNTVISSSISLLSITVKHSRDNALATL